MQFELIKLDEHLNVLHFNLLKVKQVNSKNKSTNVRVKRFAPSTNNKPTLDTIDDTDEFNDTDEDDALLFANDYVIERGSKAKFGNSQTRAPSYQTIDSLSGADLNAEASFEHKKCLCPPGKCFCLSIYLYLSIYLFVYIHKHETLTFQHKLQ